MPRVRNWKDLTFYRPAAEVRYRHIDPLFGEPGRNVIDWELIEAHYADVMRVVLSVQEGKISSATLLRRLSTYSRRNNIYQAFREIGRAIRTVQLLRFLSDAQLRRRTTAETNKVESYNNFSSWCRFGNAGVIAANDPEEQEKILKFSTLMTNAVIFHTTLDMMTVIRELIAEGWQITPADLAVLPVRDRPHPALRGLCHRRDRPDPRTLQRPPGHRPGRRILNSPDPAPSFRNRPWRVLGLSWLHPVLGLVLNCAVLWTTVYLAAAVRQLKAQGYPVRDEDMARPAPFVNTHLCTAPTASPCPTWPLAPSASCATRTPPTGEDDDE